MAYPGGNAFNVALFAGENGAEAAFLGTISDDELGMHLISVAKKKGIDISHAPVKKGILGRAAVRIIDGNRVFDSDFFGPEHGVGTLFPPMLSEEDLEYVKSFDLVDFSCYAYIEDTLERTVGFPVLKSFDFSEEPRYRTEEYLKRICPLIDLGLFSGEKMSGSERELLARKAQNYGCRNVLITMGPQGQLFYTAAGVFEGNAKLIEPLDTMGAGDSFFAAFLTALLKEGWRYGSDPASSAVKAALKAGAEYSAKNCMIRGSSGNGLHICYEARKTV